MTRVHVVSDVHGNADALARAGEGADALIVLGDLLDFIDYHEYGNGIFGALFGPDNVATFARLRRLGAREEMAAFTSQLWAGLADPDAAVHEAINKQYAALFAAMTTPTYVIPGNVDAPQQWSEFVHEGIRMPVDEVVEIAGMRFGFVGGSVYSGGALPAKGQGWRPYLRPRDEFDRAVAELGSVDVLCSHIPPAVAELTYDIVARRLETGSDALLDRIRLQQPRWSLFGHVHQPLAARTRIGLCECRNVGHFKSTARPHVLRW